MNLSKFIETFTDDTLLNATGSRRTGFSQFGKVGKNLALASLPFGLGMASQKTKAASIAPGETPIEALQLALTLEYLEAEFYNIGLQSNNLIPAAGTRDRKVFEQIALHENSHVAFLISALGTANFVAKPTFDFTVGGAFPTFTDYPTFLAIAQALEDTGVRAYKGQAPNLLGSPDLLTAALQIHSVEARHASEVRRLRGQKGWIVGNDRGGLPVEAQGTYDGEENTNQAGFDTNTVFPGTTAGSESFDEPISGATAAAIAGLFIV